MSNLQTRPLWRGSVIVSTTQPSASRRIKHHSTPLRSSPGQGRQGRSSKRRWFRSFAASALIFSLVVLYRSKQNLRLFQVKNNIHGRDFSTGFAQQQRPQHYANAFVGFPENQVEFPYVPISVIIPATAGRIPQISKLLESIAKGSRLPKEVILSISSVSRFSRLALPRFRNLSVTVLRSPDKKNAAQNRNLAAFRASMPVIASVDSDDVVGSDWMDTIFFLFNATNTDALVHKWFPCSTGVPAALTTTTHPTADRVLMVNPIFPAALSDVQAADWVAHPRQVNETNQLFDKGFNHPWWFPGHPSVKRDVYRQVNQREDELYVGKEDSWFLGDLLQLGFKLSAIENQLSGYCRH
jgi:hypothetical protein